MQLLQKDSDMEKTYMDADWANKTYTEYRKAYQSSMLIQDVPFLRIFNHKTYLSYIYRNHKHSRSQGKTYLDALQAKKTSTKWKADPGCTISEIFESDNISELYLDLY